MASVGKPSTPSMFVSGFEPSQTAAALERYIKSGSGRAFALKRLQRT
jgi:hypothetical protein